VLDSGGSERLLLEVEVVEILERRGRRLARVRIAPDCVLDLAANDLRDLHLGDRLMIDGSFVVRQLAPGTEGLPSSLN
jgi:hypothetical protein